MVHADVLSTNRTGTKYEPLAVGASIANGGVCDPIGGRSPHTSCRAASLDSANSCFRRSTPLPAIGGRASAVVVMVEPKQIVVRTAVAGHRLPHCRRDDSTGLGLRCEPLCRCGDHDRAGLRSGRRPVEPGGERFFPGWLVAVLVLSTSV